jgi:hypothetical protein
MIENLSVISFGIGLALLGLWIVTGSGRELAVLRQQGLRGRAPTNPDRFKRRSRE